MRAIFLLLPFIIGVKSQSVDVEATFDGFAPGKTYGFYFQADGYDDNWVPTSFAWSLRGDFDENTEVKYEYKTGRYPNYTMLLEGTTGLCDPDPMGDPGGAAVALWYHGLQIDGEKCPLNKFETHRDVQWKIGTFTGNFGEVFSKLQMRKKRQAPGAGDAPGDSGNEPDSPSADGGGPDGDPSGDAGGGPDGDAGGDVGGGPDGDAGGDVGGDAGGDVGGDVDGDAGGDVGGGVDGDVGGDGDVGAPELPDITVELYFGDMADITMMIKLAT